MEMGQTQVLDLYKLCVEMADRVSARRTSANSFFLTLHTTLLGVFSFFGGAALVGGGKSPGGLFFLVIAIAGPLLSAAWWLLLKSYRDLNAAKFEVISSMERDFAVQPYSDEWQLLQQDRVKGWRKRYAEQGVVERLVPGVFAILYILLAGVVSIS